MSNVAGKAYAMNVLTPLPWYKTFINKIYFKAVTTVAKGSIKGLITLSLIHFARWTIIGPKDFPRLSKSQPKEKLKYAYMLFNSNFNGSWDQYVDSFSSAIPSGLNLFWQGSLKYPKSVPFTPFRDYIRYNQIDTDYYYSAYPMASSNDVKAAIRTRKALLDFVTETKDMDADKFKAHYDQLLRGLQLDLSEMGPTPVVSMASLEVQQKRAEDSEPVAQLVSA
ncbi:MAG: hypothetical protein V3T17_09935 [Pseudomonadales bacterium]